MPKSTEEGGPSIYLSWAELACRDGTPYPRAWRETRALQLSIEFNAIRVAVDAPIVVLSAYRTPDWNRKVGGRPKSEHLEGRALDIKVPGWAITQLAAVVKARATHGIIRGIGVYPTFVHFDIRPSDTLVEWMDGRMRADLEA